MDFVLLGIVIILFIIVMVAFAYLYNAVAINSQFVVSLSELVSRTFREYYANEDIEPVVINNGIDLVWSGDVEGTFNEDNKMGFITILTNESNVNSPIVDIKEADLIASKVIQVVNEYVKDRDSKIRWLIEI